MELFVRTSNLELALAEIPSLTEGQTIPKMIYQTCRSQNDLPSEVIENINLLRRVNASWGYKLYEDKDIEPFIEDAYGPQILKFYRKINPVYGAAKADFFRYLLLYYYGGVYLDIKSTTKYPLDEMLLPDDKYILSHWQNQVGERYEGFGLIIDGKSVDDREFQQWHVIATAGHPFLRSVIETVLQNIDRYDSWKFKTGFKGVHATTGPWTYTKAIRPLIRDDNCRIIKNETEIGLEYTFYTDKFAHHKFGGIHYSTRPQPVVIHYGYRWISAKIYELSKRARVLVRERLSV